MSPCPPSRQKAHWRAREAKCSKIVKRRNAHRNSGTSGPHGAAELAGGTAVWSLWPIWGRRSPAPFGHPSGEIPDPVSPSVLPSHLIRISFSCTKRLKLRLRLCEDGWPVTPLHPQVVPNTLGTADPESVVETLKQLPSQVPEEVNGVRKARITAIGFRENNPTTDGPTPGSP